MVARLFDTLQIKTHAFDKLFKWFLSDFPYRVSDFDGMTVADRDEQGEVLKNFRMLSLLMIKETTPEISSFKELYKDEIPFKKCNSSAFSELDKETWSAVFFPLRIYESEIPSWGLVVKSDKGKRFFLNACTGSWNSSWNYKDDGASCRLAEILAEKLLQSGNRDHIYAAAKEWIVTGDVEDGKVKLVGLGNKLKLNTQRKFIIPNDNRADVADSERKRLKRIYSADSVEKALHLVTNQGVTPFSSGDFPEKIDELHILVGESIAPQLSSIILLNPEKVVLWCSDSKEKSKLPAECMRRIIELCGGSGVLKSGNPEICELELPSDSMDKAEDVLMDYFKKNSCGSKNIVFNVTSSNRIMGFAVQTIARIYSDNVYLVYRDIDSAKSEKGENADKYFFHILQYSSFPPAYGDMSFDVFSGIDLNWLRNGILKGKDEEISAEKVGEFSKRYYDKLIKH